MPLGAVLLFCFVFYSGECKRHATFLPLNLLKVRSSILFCTDILAVGTKDHVVISKTTMLGEEIYLNSIQKEFEKSMSW